ncbi:heat shock transcription factor, Y-linked-like [Lagopus muta]|uniref:heat shock transcription factor, Y-linked-like n=1 Tax=Lagopus muta TaxID=64668 RepID=UPI00209CD901|nr:heat shock transcription factor, Y-linked-like [Lagopus muta]
METSSSETPGVSVPNAGSADPASSVPQRWGKRTARDAALGPTREEDTSQGSQEQSCAKRQRLDLSTKGSCKAHDSACCFLTKLRKIVDSDCFQSIWWGDDENTIVIEETLFKTEVLGRTGPLHNLSIGCMKAFVRQLHLHGFFIVDSDLPTAASRAKRPAGAAASVCSELLCYYNPSFKKEYPCLQKWFKRSAGVRRRASAAFPPELDFEEGPVSSLTNRRRGPAASAGSEPAASNSGAGGDRVGHQHNSCHSR